MERSISLRVGVVGCGLIAQVMHLPNLQRLADRFRIEAVCDLSPRLVELVGNAFGVGRRSTRWEDLLDEPLDAVLILTSGDHAPVAVAAAEAGCHVFVEKPLSLSVDEGHRMVRAASSRGVRLMVGYMKRHDPAYERLEEEVRATAGVRHAVVTTLESPWRPYVAHHWVLERPGPEPAVDGLLARMREEEDRRLAAAIGADDPSLLGAYRAYLLDSMVHEFNLARALLGEPSAVEFASVRPEGVTAVMSFGRVQCVFSWVDLPGIARYRQEISILAPERRLHLRFPSPYLRNAPTSLVIEEGEVGGTRSWETSETVSFESAFERELLEFHASIVEDREPRTPGVDGLRDVALCAAVVRSHLAGGPVARPTRLPDEP
ncbi:MAG TPA: Gfo/Idh/MocA family oxidoreductase [Actinomycetota bacterium]|nr:Gfo/Idh/MocA family oxidoreductase [Actinomycetota bacterium]